MEQSSNRPKVGIGVVIKNEGKVLLGKRKNAHGDGKRGFPGGHLEYQESREACSIRETMEETSLSIKGVHLGTVTNDVFEKEEKHYITLFMIAEYSDGVVKIMEPDKCEKRERFERESLPENIFLPIKNAIASGFNPFDSTKIE